MSDHALNLLGENFPEVWPSEVKASADIANWLDDPGWCIGGDGEIETAIHTLERNDSGVVLGAVEVACQKGFRTLVDLGIAAGMLNEPVDPLLYG
jgi:hypothetical protein